MPLRLLAGLLLAFAVLFEPGAGCKIEQAPVVFVDAQAVRVVATFTCGGLTCWERWLQIDGQRRGVSKVCEAPAGDRLLEVPR